MKNHIRKSIWYQRLTSKMPEFWKKVRAKALWLGGSSLAAITAAVTINNITGDQVISKTIIIILGYIVVACGFVAGTATFTTTDTNLSNK